MSNGGEVVTSEPWSTDRILPPDKERLLAQRLAQHHRDLPAGAVEDALQLRPYWFRHRYVPWLASEFRLDGANVLEVGCGTGASTIQIAERGARVTAVDLKPDALDVVRFRAELHGVADRIRVRCLNAANLRAEHADDYDAVAYTAALEHMTHAERQATLFAAWSLLRSGAPLIVLDTPNRLWYLDNHTALCPFFHWLPDDLAIDYAGFSNRPDLAMALKTEPGDRRLTLARWGRGVSFHDFQLAIGPLEQLRIAGEWDYRRSMDAAWAEQWAATIDGRYQALLQEMMPTLARPWFESELAFLLWKP